MKWYISFIFLTIIFAHEPEVDQAVWGNYYRMGGVSVGTENMGIASYGRLKRATSKTFQDIRFYGHFFKEDQEIRIRQKTSRRYMSFDGLYSFSTLVYEKNTLINVDLRYHYNQGIGLLIRNSESDNITVELGIAFDNSDYLNTEQKTSYARGGFTSDQSWGKLETKFELDYFHQVSKQVEETNLSRIQLVGEIQYPIKKIYQ